NHFCAILFEVNCMQRVHHRIDAGSGLKIQDNRRDGSHRTKKSVVKIRAFSMQWPHKSREGRGQGGLK
ncbi:hypothetical protein MUA04_00535, partial [Enterobacteriaceae bacterium H11S18]|uniref:hypothetical protein n=1 Tax=Dryocola clanedunensis TaxID=2925396 RepID=UPI0022F018E6